MIKPTPYTGNDPYIFISYSHKDTARVLPIIAQMQEAGYRVWYDEGIDPGTEWDEFIAEKLLGASFVISMISGNYLASKNCKDELKFARDENKEQLLVYIQPTTLPAGMRMRFGGIQAIFEYNYKDKEQFFQKLFSTEGIRITKKPESIPTPPEPTPIPPEPIPAPPEPIPVPPKPPVKPIPSEARKRRPRYYIIFEIFTGLGIFYQLISVGILLSGMEPVVPIGIFSFGCIFASIFSMLLTRRKGKASIGWIIQSAVQLPLAIAFCFAAVFLSDLYLLPTIVIALYYIMGIIFFKKTPRFISLGCALFTLSLIVLMFTANT